MALFVSVAFKALLGDRVVEFIVFGVMRRNPVESKISV